MRRSEKQICIISQSHLCRNPRVLKEAIVLSGLYKVTIVTSIFSARLLHQDKSLIAAYPGISLRIISDLTQKGVAAFADQILVKIGRLLRRYFNTDTVLALGYGARRYYRFCRRFNADLYLCHQEIATYIGAKLIKAGYKVGFDFEDWYSEDLLPEAQKARPVSILRRAEVAALQSNLCYTTSEVLAQKLSKVYHARQPQVIYNVFPLRPDLTDMPKRFNSPLRLIWFSQTIGPGRGLEGFLKLLEHIYPSIEINFLGNVDSIYKRQLMQIIPEQHRLVFHALVDERQLADTIADFDIGLALEENSPPSRNYTITNKFFQYLQAGLPVIATNTKGQQEAFETFRPGFMLPQQPDAEDGGRLAAWLGNQAQLQEAWARAVKAAGIYNWENESSKLLKMIQSVLEE